MKNEHIGILHYTAPPVIGGVEAVIQAHAQLFARKGYPVTVIAGRGDAGALPPAASLALLPMLDSQHDAILRMNTYLEQGELPPGFDRLVEELKSDLNPIVSGCDHLIFHNVFTKHFNLALTAALHQLIESGSIRHAVAWCHDFSWTSDSSRSKVHAGYPWDLLRNRHPGITYVSISARRQQVLAELFGCDVQDIHLVYNGVEPGSLLGLSQEGRRLAERLDLFSANLVLLMPVRVTRAKNIEYALQVLAALSQSTGAKLIITGPPDPHDPASMGYFNELKNLRRSLGVEREARFVFESGHAPDDPYFIDERVVGDLYRLSDVVFMPSHREGFGMPVLEAGLAGIPVLCTGIPAAEEIGAQEVTLFSAGEAPGDLAAAIVDLVEANPLSRFRRNIRQRYTWEAVFQRQIKPLLRCP